MHVTLINRKVPEHAVSLRVRMPRVPLQKARTRISQKICINSSSSSTSSKQTKTAAALVAATQKLQLARA